jgi:excisionase family DNA binding protein
MSEHESKSQAETVTISEAARRLGVTEKTISRRLKSGKLQCVTDEQGKRRVLLPEMTGHDDRTPDRDSDRTQPDIGVLRSDLERVTAERDREREEVEFLRQRVSELNSIVMRHALSLPASKQVLELPDTGQNDRTPEATATGQMTGQQRPTRRPQSKRRLPFWARLLGFR